MRVAGFFDPVKNCFCISALLTKNISFRLIYYEYYLYSAIWKCDQSLLLHLCSVINHIRNQIKKRRAEKRLTQSDVALDLGITPGAYNKIESGPTAITVEKLGEIADILEVDITYFFPERDVNKAENQNRNISYATKNDLEELSRAINKMKQEIATLKASLPNINPAKSKKKI